MPLNANDSRFTRIKMPWHMLHFNDLQRKPVADQLLAFSDAYLESADSLCTIICSATDKANYAHGTVVMSLTFHSLELFLKAAIVRKIPTESFGGRVGHDLELLYKRYINLYPGKAMEFDLPFRQKPPDTLAFEPQVAKDFLAHVQEQSKAAPQDQLHRYPTNIHGEEWELYGAFEPHSFSRSLQQLKHDLSAIKLRMED